MADKNDLLILVSTLFQDNNSGLTTNEKLRTGLSAMITADLNLEELTTQEILGAIDFTGGITKNNLDVATVDMVPKNIPSAYCDYSASPNLTLTTTPQVISGWTEEILPIGISESLGVFTVATEGIYKVDLERVYENDDNNPADQVFVNITVEADEGAGYVEIFSRTLPIASATAGDEPSVLSFTTPSNRAILAGTHLRVLVSASDDGGNPQDTRLISAKVVANLIHNIPS